MLTIKYSDKHMGKSLQKEIGIVATLKWRIFWTYVVISGLPSKITNRKFTINIIWTHVGSFWEMASQAC